MVDFVFDENCYICAMRAERTDQSNDWLASRLLQLLQVRHRWILTTPIRRAYYHQIRMHAGGDRSRNALAQIRSLRDIEFDADRCRWLQDLEPVPGNYDHDDDHMVEAAAAVEGSLLITLDDRLRNALIGEDIPIRCGFSVLDVAGAWQLLRPQPER